MSLSRKRFRPLDIAEKRQVRSDQRLGLEILGDELSYCLSWPDASLAALLTSAPTYAQEHAHHKNTINAHGNSSKIHYGSGVSLASSDKIGVTSLNGLSRQAATTPPTVLLDSVPIVYDLRTSCVLGSPTDNACNDDLGEFLQDMRPILERVTHAEKCSNTADIMVTTEFSNNPTSSTCQSQPKKPREDHRAEFYPPQRSVCYEDSIFSLDAEQLNDAKAAGLIRPSISDRANAKREQKNRHLEHVVVLLANDPNPEKGIRQPMQETGFHTASSDSEPCLQRRRIENEVVALEWRAFYQSKRIAAALRRLLSLKAAVPFEPLESNITEVGIKVSDDDCKSRKCSSPFECDLDAWREKVYCLWLHWRLCSAQNGSVLTTSSQYQDRQSTVSKPALLDANCSSQEANALRACFHKRYPWGPSLLASAYLYDTQGDYFINPQQSSLPTTPSPSSIPPPSSASIATPFVISRRRGIYNFLRWRIELYTARLIQTRSSVAASAASSPSAQRERGTPLRGGHDLSQARSLPHGGNAIEADAVPEIDRNNRGSKHLSQSIELQNTLLGANVIDFLVNREVLAKPLVEVQQDTQQDRLDVLECRDLKQDVEMWRGWLSKV